MTTVSIAPILTTVPAMALLLLMTLALVPSIPFVCNTQKRREKAAIAQREREKEEEEREEREMIREMANARLGEELAAEANKRAETRSKRIEELMERMGIDKREATNCIRIRDNQFPACTDLEWRRIKMRARVRAELKRKEQQAREKKSQERDDFEKIEKDLRSGEGRKEATPVNGTKSDEKNSNAEK